MSIHIDAKVGDIADTVFLPGDPVRAVNIAEEYFSDIKLVSEKRAMSCLSGTVNGKAYTVMGSGMGLPSISIYVHELIEEYGVKKIVRLGSCGSFQKEVNVGDIVLAMGACTNSNINNRRFNSMNYAPLADFELISKAFNAGKSTDRKIHVGNVLASDTFYNPDPDEWKLWASYNVLAVDMESSELYTLAAKRNVQALTVLTVSDSLVDQTHDLLNKRDTNFKTMVDLALAATS